MVNLLSEVKASRTVLGQAPGMGQFRPRSGGMRGPRRPGHTNRPRSESKSIDVGTGRYCDVMTNQAPRNDHSALDVPVWTLATQDTAGTVSPPAASRLTPARLAELRSALATFSDAPLVTLEAYPLPTRQRTGGLPLDATSPLARELVRLISERAREVPAVAQVAESSEVLYRMVVPAKVASQMGTGVVKSMSAKASQGGIYDGLVNAASGRLMAKASFVPVERAAAGVAGASSAGTAAGAVAAGSAMTLAAPLVLMAVAVGMSAYADQERQKAIDRIADLLETLQNDQLDRERSELDGCRDSIDKATALLLDRGRVGASLGLDSAVHAISRAIAAASRRTKKWEAALAALDDRQVELDDLEEAFPGISTGQGEFVAHLELATLAIAMKRRVVILQGVEAGQSAENNPFENFASSLKADQLRIDELEDRIRQVLLRISSLQLQPPSRLMGRVMTRKAVDELLGASYRLRSVGQGLDSATAQADVLIDIEKRSDGSLQVLPAQAV